MSEKATTPRIPRTAEQKPIGDNAMFYYTETDLFIHVDLTKRYDIAGKKNFRIASTEGNRTLDREKLGNVRCGLNVYIPKDLPPEETKEAE